MYHLNDQIIRHQQILRHLPREPRSITVSRLRDLLLDQGIDVNVRTLQRDMNSLSEVFIGIDSSRNLDNSLSWFWREDAPNLQLSGLSINQALSFYMVKQYLAPLLPSITLDELAPFFEQAEATLDAIQENNLAKWSQKVAVVPPNQPLQPPEYDLAINKTVRLALLSEKQLDILYERGDGEIKRYQINPVGMVVRNIISYLIATKTDTSEIRMFAMHRMRNASVLSTDAMMPNNFQLKDYIDKGHMGFNMSGESDVNQVCIKLKFRQSASKHLLETPISNDQTISAIDSATNLVTATVPENEQLIWWILSFGNHVEVVEPVHLRQKIADVAAAMAQKYNATMG